MRTLSTAMVTAIGAAVTRPGFLVQIDFASIVRLSSRGQVTWNGQTWAPWAMQVSGCGIDGNQSAQNGSIVLGNPDYTIGALVLAEGVADRPVRIWKYDGGAIATGDPTLIFSGVADGATFAPADGAITIGLQQSSNRTLYCPRGYITEEAGFSFLPAIGTLVPWNGEVYEVAEDA